MLQQVNIAIAAFLVLELLLVSSSNVSVFAYRSSVSLTHNIQLVEEEVDALLKWKSSLINQNHSLLSSWKVNSTASTTSPCKWYGINCNREGRVDEVNIAGLGLQGTLHKFNFSSFSNFVSLDLSSNELFGTIPSRISILSKLTHLDLSFNKLSGHIPPEIASLTSLLYLDHKMPQIGNLYYF
ncbi:hypothetical protein MKX03_024923 [Papaver bracteatum]|nr:hypothetical protein MKX03_024923 [Papaver bracteatum]